MTQSDRFVVLDRILADPPRVHPDAPGGVWATSEDCYRFIAHHVPEGGRTLETGCGTSTALLAAWGARHTCVVPNPSQERVIREYLRERSISDDSLTFDLRPSETALPAMTMDGELDLVLIDGCHGFPVPIIDWFYTAGRLASGGMMIVDDAHLPQVSALTDFLDADPRWRLVVASSKWRSYERLSSGPVAEEWTSQEFFGHPRRDAAYLKSRIYAATPRPLRSPGKALVRAIRGSASRGHGDSQ